MKIIGAPPSVPHEKRYENKDVAEVAYHLSIVNEGHLEHQRAMEKELSKRNTELTNKNVELTDKVARLETEIRLIKKSQKFKVFLNFLSIVFVGIGTSTFEIESINYTSLGFVILGGILYILAILI